MGPLRYVGLGRVDTISHARCKPRNHNFDHPVLLSHLYLQKDNEESKDEEEREDDDEDEEAYFTDEYDEYESSDEDVAESEVDEVSKDIQYFMPSSLQLYATFGSMMLSRRVNFFDPTVVRLIR